MDCDEDEPPLSDLATVEGGRDCEGAALADCEATGDAVFANR